MTHPAAATPLYDTAALRGVETAVAGAPGGDAGVLMARAGLAAWHALLEHWPAASRIAVCCGPGNNGGDGYVLARHAHEAGREVRVVRLAGHAPRSGLARAACAAFEAGGGHVDAFAGALPPCDLVVDAVFGIGLSQAPDVDSSALLAAIAAAGADVLSLDVPSGIAVDRASAPGSAVHATRTLQFLAHHAGLRTGPALDHAGALSLAALDVPATAFDGIRPVAWLRSPDALRGGLAPRRPDAHKGDAGHVLCIGGDSGKGGAVLLAAEAALRSGAGLVSVATRPAHVAALLARRPEAMVLGIDSAQGAAGLLDAAGVVAIGPGLGQEAWGQSLLEAALATGKPLVLDADALNLLARTRTALPNDAVITPHPGEAGRLLGCAPAQVQSDRLAAAQALCARLGCVVVLKGAGTIVAAPDQPPRIIDAGNPGMAVGGMGDLLTGVVAALRAQGHGAFEAASLGALLHATAGDAAAAADGQRGLLPCDLLPALRREANR